MSCGLVSALFSSVSWGKFRWRLQIPHYHLLPQLFLPDLLCISLADIPTSFNRFYCFCLISRSCLSFFSLFLPFFIHSWLYLFLLLNFLISHVLLSFSFYSFVFLCFVLCIFIISSCIVSFLFLCFVLCIFFISSCIVSFYWVP